MSEKDQKPEETKLSREKAEKLVYRELDIEKLEPDEVHRAVDEMRKAEGLSSETRRHIIDI